MQYGAHCILLTKTKNKKIKVINDNEELLRCQLADDYPATSQRKRNDRRRRGEEADEFKC